MHASMTASPPTRATLLVRIRDPHDRMAWEEFVRLYAPMIHAYGMRRGLQDADAADLAQEVLLCVLRSVPGFAYDPARGSFRGWLFQVTRHQMLKWLQRKNRQPVGTGASELQQFLEQQPDEAGDAAAWDREYQWHLFHWAARRVQPEFRETTWRAFWMTAIENREVDAVAAELGMTCGAVYIARSRITARLRQEIASMEAS